VSYIEILILRRLRGSPAHGYELRRQVDERAAAVAVEPIARELGASLTVVQWAVSGSLGISLIAALALPASRNGAPARVEQDQPGSRVDTFTAIRRGSVTKPMGRRRVPGAAAARPNRRRSRGSGDDARKLSLSSAR
jgi:hypothetical protein